ncbi:leucine-rich repeat domain-containing protein, partial [Tannerella forsythia]
MKNILLFILGALMAVLWTETTRAQSPGVIKITTARNVGDPIRMLISSSENVTLDGVNGTWVNGNSVTYVLTKKTVTITGNVKGFDCWYQLSDLTTLDASNCPTLETLNCGSNQLASLNVSGCTNLRTLHCANNRLTQLDLSTSGGERFWSLSCSNNQLKTLDVSACYKLMKLICERNQIKEEGMDQLIASLPDRSAMNLKGQLWLIDHTQNDEGNVCTTAQVAAAKARGWIPKEYNGSVWVDYLGSSPASVITMTTDKTVGQTIVLTFLENEAEHVTVSGATLTQSITNNGYRSNTYTLTEQNITVTGNITCLRCNRNQLTALDVSGNTALAELQCGSNQLTELDLSNNTALTELFCGENRLSRIDVSLNTQLTSLLCGDNPLTTALDVSTNTLLVELHCQNGRLSALDLSNNTRLSILECSDNQLATINLSNNINLVELICGGNKLTELDVSKNTKLHAIACSDNLLTRLDLSKTDIWGLYCARNQIKDEAMDRLIASLPNRVGQIPQCRIGIYDNTQSDEGNVCTTVQVAASKARGWIPQEHIGNWQWIDYNGSEPAQLPTLSVSPATLDFVAAGEGKVLTVTSNTSWTAVSSAAWLTLSAGSGTNAGSITATAAANEATSVRTATITFTADTVTRIVTVTQAAASAPPPPPAPTLSVSPATLNFAAT